MPVSVDDSHPDCSGVAVVEPDGTIVDGGCHPNRSDAEAMRDAINASKGTDDGAEVALSDLSEGLHIFRAGEHLGANGNTIDYSEQDVEQIAELYDPDDHEAPLVIGHPSDNQPAFGWVEDLAASEGDLYATPHQVEENFAEAVRSGRFKKISASFYPPGHPNHPLDHAEAPYLRHVGFLGAKAPAVKGLETPELADDDDLVTVTYDLADMPHQDPQTALERLMSMFAPALTSEVDNPEGVIDRVTSALRSALSGGTDDAAEAEGAETDSSDSSDTQDSDSDMPDDEPENDEATDTPDSDEEPQDESDDVDAEEEETPNETGDSGDEETEDASDPDQSVEARLDELEERLESKEEELEAERKKRKAAERKAERVEDLSEREEDLRRQEIADTVQEAAENGRIHGKHAPLWREVLELAEEADSELDTAVVDFSEADLGTDEAKDLRETLEYIMNHQGPVVALGEIAGPDDEAEPVDFSDADSLRQAAKQEQKRAEEEEGTELRYAEAMDRVLERREE